MTIMIYEEKNAMEEQDLIDYVRLQQTIIEGKLSHCVKHNVGCLITDRKGRIVSSGRNGTAENAENCDDVFPDWGTKLNPEQCRRHHDWQAENEIHAEINALLYSKRDEIEGGTIYVSMEPCGPCTKTMKNSGVRRIVFARRYHRVNDEQRFENKRSMAKLGIQLIDKSKLFNEEDFGA